MQPKEIIALHLVLLFLCSPIIILRPDAVFFCVASVIKLVSRSLTNAGGGGGR